MDQDEDDSEQEAKVCEELLPCMTYTDGGTETSRVFMVSGLVNCWVVVCAT